MKKILTLLSVLSICISALSAEAEKQIFTVKPGETVFLSESYVKFNSRIDATVTFKKFQPFSVGCGKDMFQGCWVEVTAGDYTQYTNNLKRVTLPNGKKSRLTDTTKVGSEVALEFALKKQVKVCITTDYKKGNIVIESKGGRQEGSLKGWSNAGAVFFTNNGKSPVDVELAFTRLAAKEPVWFYGDSYFNTQNTVRWPYYMYADGRTHWMADHKSGGNSKTLLACLKRDLEYGTPKYLVWMLGQNDPADKDGEPSSVWLKGIDEVLSICKEKGITPILTTIPSTPKKCHSAKREWIMNSGCRYIDWYGAVMTGQDGVWKEGYLSKDNVHPDKAGAAALWEAVKKAIPELE